MISSTIAELADIRSTVDTALDEQGLAEGWLFEVHSTASGHPPENRYLEAAHSCDLYVIIVAAQRSQATEAEYHAAFADNPTKILAFYLGDTAGDTAELRSLIDSRHTRVPCREPLELPPLIVSAISDYIQSGEIVRYPLIAELDRRLRQTEAVVMPSLPLSFIPVLRSDERSRTDGELDDSEGHRISIEATAAPREHHQIVLEGIGGSGKTYTALAISRHLAKHGVLPVVLSPTNNQISVSELILAELDAVRFYPGETLLHEMARSGRLAVVVDGVDALSSDARRLLLHDLEEFARRFPRSQAICCVRRSLPGELLGFSHFNIDPLSDAQTAAMFEALNAAQIDRFPSQIADLARWPLWAWALVEVGPNAETGLVLLQRLLEHRIQGSGSFLPLEAQLLLDAAAVLAYEAWPESTLEISDALDHLTGWRSSEQVASRYSPPPASVIVDRLSGAGIIQEARQLNLAHPLFATYLAARHAVFAGALRVDMRNDGELAMFVAALLPEERCDEQIALLDRHGPVGRARFLRLMPERDRTLDPSDPTLFGSSLQTLDGTAAVCIATETWTAWRASENAGTVHPDSIGDWLTEGEIAFMRGNVFKRRTPVTLAAIESLARFKGRAMRLRPSPDNWHEQPSPSEMTQLRRIAPAELDEMLLQVVLDWRRRWREIADAIGVGSLPEIRIPDGEPQLSLILDWSDPRLRVDWGDRAEVTRVPPSKLSWDYESLFRFLGPGWVARIYRDIISRTEMALGCRLGSQAWNQPERVAAWAW